MIYKRSSFLRYLTDTRKCEIIPLREGREQGMNIRNGIVTIYVLSDKKDRIDYEEIYIICKKLNVTIPSGNDLELFKA